MSRIAGSQTDAEDSGTASSGTDMEALEVRMEKEHQEWLEESREYIEENMDSCLKREADMVFRLEDGREYRMLVTDYVMGDCFYILLGVEADGASVFLLNPDPFNQDMGYIKWMTFVNEDLGDRKSVV